MPANGVGSAPARGESVGELIRAVRQEEHKVHVDLKTTMQV